MLSVHEFMMHEHLTLATIQAAIFEFCREHAEVVVFGAQAVNAYVETARMTEDVDIMSPTPETTANALVEHLGRQFHIAVRVREVKPGLGYRVYQPRPDKNRHLADVRLTPPDLEISERNGLRFTSPAFTIAMKVVAYGRRRNQAKGFTDRADLQRLLLSFPELRTDLGEVASRLGPKDAALWRELLAEPIEPDDDSDGY